MIAASANVPDELHLKIMEEERAVMMSDIADVTASYAAAKLKLRALTAAAGDAPLDQQPVSAEIANLVQEVERLRIENDTLKDIEVIATAWNDPSRTDDTAFGGSGCWGSNIVDDRLETRLYRKDNDGNKIPGSETIWQLCQMIQDGSRVKDSRNVVDADQFFLITADADGSNKARKSLKNVTSNAKRFFPCKGLDKPNLTVGRVAVAHRMAFVPVPKDTAGWAVEVRYVSFGYNTTDEKNPKNVTLFGDSMNTTLSSEKPGFKDGFSPKYTEITTTIGGAANEPAKMRCFATAVEATDRSIKDMGTETAEQSAAAAAVGKGTSVRTGPSSVKPTSSSAWLVHIPIKDKRPEIGVRLRGGGAIYRSLGSLPGNESEGEAIHQTLSAEARDEPDDGIAAEDRVPRGAASKRTSAKEGRVGIGTVVQDASLLPVDSPEADGDIAVAMEVLIMTIPRGTVPSKETFLDGASMLKQRFRQASEIANCVVEDRLSQVAVDAGLTVASPLKKKAKTEIEQAVGAKIFAPGSENEAIEIAKGRPLLTGVPVE